MAVQVHHPATRRRILRRILAAAAVACSPACTRGAVVGILGEPVDGSVADVRGRDAADVAEAGPMDGTDGASADCADGGAPPQVTASGGPDGGTTVYCAGSLAERTFRQALCSCTDLDLGSPLRTDGFDSRRGAYAPGEPGGDVRVNRGYRNSNTGDIGGSLVVTGPAGLSASNPHVVRTDLMLDGPLSASGLFRVQQDAWILGDITAPDGLTVGRDLYYAAGARRSGTVTVGGTQMETTARLAPACACEPGRVLDVAGIVAHGERDNDNDSAGLRRDALNDVDQSTEVELPCGRFYLEQIRVTNAVVLHIRGRAAVFVGGSVTITNPVSIQIDPAGELDLFIGGNLEVSNPLTIAGVGPAAVRIYVGGTAVTLGGGATFVGNMYAPHALVHLTSSLELFGSIFAGALSASGSLDVHFDRAILDAGFACHGRPPG